MIINYRDVRALRLDDLSVSRTYGGLLEGMPTPEQIVLIHLGRLKRMWGPRKTPITPWKTKEGVLPEYCIAVWVSCLEPVHTGDGSEIVLVWFGPNVPTASEIETHVLDIDWLNQAQDFEI